MLLYVVAIPPPVVTPSTALEVSPHASGWQVYEEDECCPVFPLKTDAVSYARFRTAGTRTAVHVLTEDCSIEEIIAVEAANR